MSELRRYVITETEEEQVLRALSGRKLAVRERDLDLKTAARWLHDHLDATVDEIVLLLLALGELGSTAVITGDRWQMLPCVEDGSKFVLATLELED